ncbi:MAG: hypothetical protein SPJ06_00945 [Bacilli bacterium]|nr:hypothetical protein [bacterium]MDY5992542.1 hypothetical protein [Bacilli bacterium]
MELENQYKLLVLGYYGMMYLDDYDLKVYILKDIEEYIKAFIKNNPIKDFDYKEMALKYESESSKKTQLQDTLIVLHKIKAPMEVILLVKKHLKEEEEKEKRKRDL